MQTNNDAARDTDVPGLQLMKRIRNDPEKYVRRSDFGPKRDNRLKEMRTPENVQRERDYLIAPIDDAGYIDFSVPAKARKQV
jgi:hypothetical protein